MLVVVFLQGLLAWVVTLWMVTIRNCIVRRSMVNTIFQQSILTLESLELQLELVTLVSTMTNKVS